MRVVNFFRSASAIVPVVVFCQISSINSFAQANIALETAQALVNSIPNKKLGCEAAVPLGEWDTSKIDLSTDTEAFIKFVLKAISAFQSHGVVKVTTLTKASDGLFQQRLKIDVLETAPQAEIHQQNRWLCLRASAEPPSQDKVVKVDQLKAGPTQWDAAVIYSTYSYHATTLYKTIESDMGVEVIEDQRRRYLYKLDPINNNWVLKAQDIGPLTSDTWISENVPRGLLLP